MCWPPIPKMTKPQDAYVPAASVVARGGVEPPTYRFSVGRSYQLSYLAVALTAAGNHTGAEGCGAIRELDALSPMLWAAL